jgi:predicted dehydrogenase
MADYLRAGIIGAGFIGAVHADAVRAARGVVSRVAASSPSRAAEAADRLGALAPANGAEELIDADDVDVVHICTPNALHVPLARRALAAGKPVVCEKPLATTLDDARELMALAAETGVVATVPFVYRFYPTVREARARIADGEAGTLRLLHGHYLQDWQAQGADPGWRGEPVHGGAHRAFADIGVHWCDLVEFLTGHRIAALVARTADGGTQSTVLFATDRGASGSVVVSQTAPGRKNSLVATLEGDDASFGFDQQQPEILRIGTVAENRVVLRGASDSSTAARYSVLPPGHPQGYQDCFAAFVRDCYAAVRGEHPDGLPTFDDGARSAALLDAVIASSASSTWVEVPT